MGRARGPLVLAAVGLLASLTTSPALAAGTTRRAAAAKAPPTESVGSPNEGRLEGGKALTPSKALRSVGGHRWGVPSLVGMLERSAAKVAKRFSGSVLVVGDLSRRGGGDVEGHRSHESGRDADVGFYLKKGSKPWVSPRFVAVDEEGKTAGLPSVRFDDARNWALVEAWLTDRDAEVQLILVAQHLKVRLLAEARRAGAAPELVNRAAMLMVHPSRGLPHDDHFHVRVACPRSSAECIEYGTPEKKRAKASGDRGPKPPARASLKRRSPKKS